MERRNGFPSIWALFLGVTASVPALAIPYLSGGSPGCYQQILERPMNEASAAHLVPKCRELRAAYLGSLKQYSSDPKKFESEVAVAIKNNTTPAPAYHAILMAAAFEDTRLEPALQARAKLEQAKKWRLQYASAALERIKTGRCGHAYDDPAYVEICRVTSPVAKRLVDWAKAGR